MAQGIITRDLKYELTQEELLIYSKQLAKNQQDRNETESSRKSAMADYKDKIMRLDSEI